MIAGLFLSSLLFLCFFYGQIVEAAPEIPIATNSRNVSSWDELKKVLGDPLVDEIKFTKDIKAESNISNTQFSNRNLTIDGQGKYTLDMADKMMELGSFSVLYKMITVKGLTITGSSTASTAVFSLIYNMIHFHDVTVRNRMLAYSTPNVYFSGNCSVDPGTNPFGNNQFAMVEAGNISIENNFSFTNSGEVNIVLGRATYSILIANSSVTIDSNSTANIFELNKSARFHITNNSTLVMKKVNRLLKTSSPLDFFLSDSKLNLDDINEFISTTAVINAKIENEAQISGSVKAGGALFNNKKAPVNVIINRANLKGLKNTGYIAETDGIEAPLTVNVQNSKIDLENGGFFSTLGKAKLETTIQDSTLTLHNLTNFFIKGSGVKTIVKNTSIRIENVQKTAFYIQKGIGNSQLDFNHANIYARQEDKSTSPLFFIEDSDTNMNFNQTNIDSKLTRRFVNVDSSASGSKINILNGSVWEAYSKESNVLRSGGDVTNATETAATPEQKSQLGTKNFLLNIEGKETRVYFGSDSSDEGLDGGVVSIYGPESKVTINNGASAVVKSLNQDASKGIATPSILLQTLGGGLYLDNGSNLEVENLSSRSPVNTPDKSAEAAISFRGVGAMALELRNQSKVNLYRTGTSSGLQMFGGDNKIFVGAESDFTVHSKGNGNVSDGGTAGNAAIQFSSNGNGKNAIETSGENASLSVIADSGLAIDGGNNQLDIITSKKSSFVARGQSATAGVGIIKGKNLTIHFDTMNYYDVANTRIDGGALFSATDDASTLVAEKTNLSLWLAGQGQNVMVNESTQYLASQRFDLTGANLNTFKAGSDPIKAYLEKIGGMNKISRMTGSNQQAIVDVLRVPTNADKYIWAHVVLKEGKEAKSRPAYENEVHVKVEVRNPDQTVAYTAQGVSIGNGSDNKGISIYGEEKKTGLVKIPIPENKFIESGQTVHLLEAWVDLGEGEKRFSEGTNLMAKPVTTLDVTPPKKTGVSEITNATKQLSGKADENGVKVFVKVNNQWLKDGEGNLISAVVEANSWLINLPYYLTKEDKVDVYLKDETNSQVLPEYALPKTYTTEPDGRIGNLNCAVDDYSSYQGYHDAINDIESRASDERFDPAVRSAVVDVIPVPKLEQSVVSSGGQATSYGDRVTYIFKASNDCSNGEPWKNVILTDVLAEGLDFDSNEHEITIDGKVAKEMQFKYDVSSRKLTINLGDVRPKQTVEVTISVKISKDALLGKNILNQGTATGDSPQEEPFIQGANIPESKYQKLSVSSSEIGVPGSAVYGILSFVSAPESLNFGNIQYSATTKRVETPEFAQKLVVNDVRENVTAGWYVTATLSQAMINDKKQELVNAMRYVYKGEESILNEHAQVVYTNLDSKRGEYIISDHWGKQKGSDGIKLQIEGKDDVYTGSYQGVITWKLMAGQP